MTRLNIGAHLSLGGKPRSTVEQAARDGFRSMQIFASSPGAWKPPVWGHASAEAFRAARGEHGVDPLFIHAIYLINLASSDTLLVQRSRSSLITTMRAGSRLGASGVITHIGSHAGRGFDEVRDQIADQLRAILEETPDDVDLVLENSAGAGGIIGAELDELGALVQAAQRPARLKVALDTAHLCGAGWDFADRGTASRLVDEIEHTFGMDRLLVIHANDSARPCGSRRDRHANIGDGFIGYDGFQDLAAQEPLRAVPWILETPDLEKRVEDRSTLEALAVQSLPAEVLGGS